MTEIDAVDPILEVRYALRRQYDDARRLRALVLDLADSGNYSQRELAKRLGVSHRTIANWVSAARAERDEVPYRPNFDHLPRRT